MMSSKPPVVIAKVKPYTVVDLSTKRALSDEEITKCLQSATLQEEEKLANVYDDFFTHSGGPTLPTKMKKSLSFSGIEHVAEDLYDTPPPTTTSSGTGRQRSYTAPTSSVFFMKPQQALSPPLSRAKLSFSPGCTRRKIQQKNMQAAQKSGLRAPTQLKPMTRVPAKTTALPKMSPHSSYSTDEKIRSTGIPQTNSGNAVIGKSSTLPRNSGSGLAAPKSYAKPDTQKVVKPSGLPSKGITPPRGNIPAKSSSKITPPKSNIAAQPVSGSRPATQKKPSCLTPPASYNSKLQRSIPARSCSSMGSKLSLESLDSNSSDTLPRPYKRIQQRSASSASRPTSTESSDMEATLLSDDSSSREEKSPVIPTTNTSQYAKVNKTNNTKSTSGIAKSKTNELSKLTPPTQRKFNGDSNLTPKKLNGSSKLISPNAKSTTKMPPKSKIQNNEAKSLKPQQTSKISSEELKTPSMRPSNPLASELINENNKTESKDLVSELNSTDSEILKRICLKTKRSQSDTSANIFNPKKDAKKISPKDEFVESTNPTIGKISDAMNRSYGSCMTSISHEENSAFKTKINDYNVPVSPKNNKEMNGKLDSDLPYSLPDDSIEDQSTDGYQLPHDQEVPSSPLDYVNLPRLSNLFDFDDDKEVDTDEEYNALLSSDPFSSFIEERRKKHAKSHNNNGGKHNSNGLSWEESLSGVGASDKNNKSPKTNKKSSPINLSDRSLSPFKSVKPPPSLSCAQPPIDYQRTPSTDVDEPVYYKEDDLKEKAREVAMKTLGKRNSEINPTIDENDDEGKNNDPFDSYVAEMVYNNQTNSQQQQQQQPNEMYHQLHSMTLDRDKKKKSKIKKFFQKLSTKKDTNGKIEFEYYNAAQDSAATAEGNNNTCLCDDLCDNARYFARNTNKRYSAVSSELNFYNNKNNNMTRQHTTYQITPTTKRRVFKFNLMKKSTRSKTLEITPPSETVRALCSPKMERRHNSRLSRRSSDPSIYRITPSPVTVMSGCRNNQDNRNTTSFSHNEAPLRRIEPPVRRNTSDIAQLQRPQHVPPPPPGKPAPPVQRVAPLRRSRFSSSEEDASSDYVNFPFSKCSMQAPRKPRRSVDKVNEISPPKTLLTSCNSNPLERRQIDTKPSQQRSDRFSSNSSDTSSIFDSQLENTMCTTPTRKKSIELDRKSIDNSLRRTPLRHSASEDYYEIVEVHRQIVDKIAAQVSRLTCDCHAVTSLQWNDFEQSKGSVNMDLSDCMVMPIETKTNRQKYSAWLQMKSRTWDCSESPNDTSELSRATLHPNCLHICHRMQQNNGNQEQQDGIPKVIQIESVYISPMIPRMTLAKYASMTLDKHTRCPEVYEREVVMLLLQIVKGVQHLIKKHISLSSLRAQHVLLIGEDDSSAFTLSPKKKPNKCPHVAVMAALTNNITSDDIIMTSLCQDVALIVYELLHCAYRDELREARDAEMLQRTLPTLTVKSVYTRHLQHVTQMLLSRDNHVIKTLRDVRQTLEVVVFGPTDIAKIDDSQELVAKWHSRRCVDLVTHLLQTSPFLMISNAPQPRIDIEIALEAEFLSDVSPQEIHRISLMLER